MSISHRLLLMPLKPVALGTSPGGNAEMAITAKVLQLGVPVVTAFQVCRLVAPIYQCLYGTRNQAN
nr:AbrB family transcriptional regulator [Polaromonas sp. A23]